MRIFYIVNMLFSLYYKNILIPPLVLDTSLKNEKGGWSVRPISNLSVKLPSSHGSTHSKILYVEFKKYIIPIGNRTDEITS